MKAGRESAPPSQFYSGLVAELYEPLLGELARADDYAPFLDRHGTPALELACGSGLPMLDLLERGYAVEGLDASGDMLERCRERASQRGLCPTLHLAEMQSFELPGRYRSIFLAGASFTLLTTDDDAERALRRIRAHLEPGGHALIPLEVIDVEATRKGIGRRRETTDAGGNRLRVGLVSIEAEGDGRTVSQRLRYERISPAGDAEVVERDWRRRCFTQPRFRDLALSAGFEAPRFLSPAGGPAALDATLFVALLRRT